MSCSVDEKLTGSANFASFKALGKTGPNKLPCRIGQVPSLFLFLAREIVYLVDPRASILFIKTTLAQDT